MVDTRSAIQALESQYDLKGVPAPSYASAIDSPQSLDWPVMNEAAYHGLAGDIVKAIEPVTEADPVALLVTTLLYFGSVIGRTAHAVVEDTPHYGAEFALIVGNSAFARKGTSEARIAEVFRQVEPDWTENNLVQGGMSSGEGLINLIRDPAEIDGATEQGISDKRRLIFEPEFARVLRVLQREGNNLSAVLRAAWDGRTLTTITKTPMKASTPHISVLGHIVEEFLNLDAGQKHGGEGVFKGKYIEHVLYADRAFFHICSNTQGVG